MGRPPKVHIDRSTLVELYVNQRLSSKELGERIGVSQQAARNYLQRYGIETRTPGAALSLKLDEEMVRRLYCEEKLTMQDVSERMQCSYGSIQKCIRRLGVVPASKGLRRLYKARKEVAGKTVDNGYSYESAPGHPSASKHGHYLASHRLIIEKAVGSILAKSEHVHHINVQKWDNRVENLAVVNSSDHARIHKYMGHVAAFLCGLSPSRPEPLAFAQDVFWGGRLVRQIDLIAQAEMHAAKVVVSDLKAVGLETLPPEQETIH